MGHRRGQPEITARCRRRFGPLGTVCAVDQRDHEVRVSGAAGRAVTPFGGGSGGRGRAAPAVELLGRGVAAFRVGGQLVALLHHGDRLVTPDLAFSHPHRPGPARGRLPLPPLRARAPAGRGGRRTLIGPHGRPGPATSAVGAAPSPAPTATTSSPTRPEPSSESRSDMAPPLTASTTPTTVSRAPTTVAAPVGACPPWPSAAQSPCCPACA